MDKGKPSIGASGEISGAAALDAKGASNLGGVRMASVYHVVCRGADGEIKWEDQARNLVVNTGLNDLLDKRFKASAYSASDWIGLTDGTPTVAAADTMASHAGWVEITAYTGNRKAFTPGTVSGQSVDNVGNEAVFAINGSATVGGLFLNTDETGTAGILYGAAAFDGGDRSVDSGDTLTVTLTLTASAA